jgi:hypothetical protein
MKPIVASEVQKGLEDMSNKDLYIHLETTNGAYATQKEGVNFSVGAFIRNTVINFSNAKVIGVNSFRVGLKIAHGWVYAEGLTHWQLDEKNRLLLAGHDENGKLAVALQLSETPF